MVRLFLLALFAFPLLVSGGCATTPTNAKVFDDLWIALEKKDRSALPQVQMVLEDAISHRDRFNHETRETAFEVLRATNMTELLPLVRQIAAMDYRTLNGSDKADLYDLVAIQEALITLREWRDPETIGLSLRRLTAHAWLQSTAIENLRLLEYWRATSDVQQLLCEVPKDPEHLGVIRELAGYLRDSPNTDPGICHSLEVVSESFSFCFQDELERWRCGDLAEDTQRLMLRLGCIGDSGS